MHSKTVESGPRESRGSPVRGWSAPPGTGGRLRRAVMASFAFHHSQSGTIRRCGISRCHTSSGTFRTLVFLPVRRFLFVVVARYSSTPRYTVRRIKSITSPSSQVVDFVLLLLRNRLSVNHWATSQDG